MRLLIVDDDATTRLAVMRCFSAEPGAEVISCETAEEVIQYLGRRDALDWLLVDWNLPGMTGYQLVCAVRANSKFDGIRILMLTSESSVGHVTRALAAGADEYLMKPFTKAMLLDKIALLGRL